jgi:hypothetical protein
MVTILIATLLNSYRRDVLLGKGSVALPSFSGIDPYSVRGGDSENLSIARAEGQAAVNFSSVEVVGRANDVGFDVHAALVVQGPNTDGTVGRRGSLAREIDMEINRNSQTH